jgi:hypothetical protein
MWNTKANSAYSSNTNHQCDTVKNKQENKAIRPIRPKQCQASVIATNGLLISHVTALFDDHVCLLFQLTAGLNQVPLFLNTDVEK